MQYNFQEILDIGLEIEFSNIKRETPIFMDTLHRKLTDFKQVHDASSETPELTLGGIPIQFSVEGKNNKFLSIMKHKSLETYGGELNSPILSFDDFKPHIYKLVDFLLDMGESYTLTEQDNRGSIHVHVNVSKDIKYRNIKRLLELGLATESIFYKLGGMGRVNRGVKNSFIYQRPLTLPPCVRHNNKFYPIFNYKDLLESKGKTDFFNRYGDTTYQINNGNHYVTQRYVGLNFYSIPYRGSIEFRYANKTLVPEWIIAWIILCQKFTEYCLTKEKDTSFEDKYRKLEDNEEIPENELLFIFDKLNIPLDTQYTLLDIWRQSETPEFNGEQILTHLPNPTFYSGNHGYLPTPVEYAKIPNVIDVRTIHSDKNNKLAMSKMLSPESNLDYYLDNTGVKRKTKELESLSSIDNLVPELRLNNDRPRIANLTVEIYHAYLAAGLDVTNLNEDRVHDFGEQMIMDNQFLPFELFRKNWYYQFRTSQPNLDIIFKIRRDDNREFSLQFRNNNNENASRERICRSIYDENYNSFGYNFTNDIETCINNPELYFIRNRPLHDFEVEEIMEELEEEIEEENNNNERHI